MSVLPQINCTLLSVGANGYSEDYDRSAGTPASKWSGEQGAYVQQKRRSSFNVGGDLSRYTETTLFVDDELRMQTDLSTGDTVTFSWKDKVHTGRVADLVSPDLPGVASYFKAVLEEVSA